MTGRHLLCSGLCVRRLYKDDFARVVAMKDFIDHIEMLAMLNQRSISYEPPRHRSLD